MGVERGAGRVAATRVRRDFHGSHGGRPAAFVAFRGLFLSFIRRIALFDVLGTLLLFVLPAHAGAHGGADASSLSIKWRELREQPGR